MTLASHGKFCEKKKEWVRKRQLGPGDRELQLRRGTCRAVLAHHTDTEGLWQDSLRVSLSPDLAFHSDLYSFLHNVFLVTTALFINKPQAYCLSTRLARNFPEKQTYELVRTGP